MEIKGILKKAVISDTKIIIGKNTINMSDVTEIKYEEATLSTQGFITFCTSSSGHEVKDLTTATTNKNSIVFYKKQNQNLYEILSCFENKVIITDVLKENRIEKSVEKTQIKNEKKAFEEEAKELEKNDVIFCPKCHSTNVFYDRKKFSIKRAVVGGVLFAGVGAIAGGLTSKKIDFKCLSCGHKWTK